jgi:hypothetical protein
MRRMDEPCPGLLARGLFASAIAATALALALTIAERRHGVGAPATTARDAARPLSPEDARRSLLRLGFSEVTRLQARGPNFTAEASTADGMTARVVISGIDGAILGMRVFDAASAARHAKAGEVDRPGE